MFALIDILFVVTCFVAIIAGYSISVWVIRGVSEIEADNNELRQQQNRNEIKIQELESQLKENIASIKKQTGEIEYLKNQIAMIHSTQTKKS